MDNLDWTLIPSFLAVAKCGSLSGAARETGVSQPTLGRHIKALEQASGCELFHRQPRGLELTADGAALLPAAQAMAAGAAELGLIAGGKALDIKGTVRITASIFFAHYMLPPLIADIRRSEPDIQLEIVATDSTDNLLFREADIAIRMFRPEQLDIVARHIGDLTLGLFATKAYLLEKGAPEGPEDLTRFDWVGYDRDERIIEGMRALGVPATHESFATRCDAQTVYWELVRAGCGIGAAQRGVGNADPDMDEVLPGLDIPTLPVWLAAPEILRRTPRIRRVWDLLAEGIATLVS